MKRPTLLAIIAILLLILNQILITVVDFRAYYVFKALDIIAYAGLLPFFITLYKKQTDKKD